MLAAILGMWLSGQSGNLMSLGAIDFGLIVDGAVIIVENVSRRLRERGRRWTGRCRERSGTRPSSPPPPRCGGLGVRRAGHRHRLRAGAAADRDGGKLFRPMAATVLFALLGAFVLSLTLVPVLASLFVRGEDDREPRPLALARRGFERALAFTARHRWAW
jgi:cobalt-zinc-cadmium resistance protein CzcA